MKPKLLPKVIKLQPASLLALSLLAFIHMTLRAKVKLLKNGQAAIQVVADVRETTTAETVTIKEAADWLVQSLGQASGAKFEISSETG